MRAAVLRAFGEPLAIEEREPPRPAPGESLVRVRAVGLCGTDLKLCDGKLGAGIALPLVPGHEVAGEVVGEGGKLPAGTRVACYVYESCGECRWCRDGRATLCPDMVRLGLERDGGLAEYVAVPTANLIPFSDRLPFEAAAVAMDSVTTPWAALSGRDPVRAGEYVLVVGAGGLGLNAVQIAVAAGAHVAAVDVAPESLERAAELGAELAVAPDGIEAVEQWSSGGVDLMVELSGSPAGFAAGVERVRPGGRIVLCGYAPGASFPLDSAAMVLGELSLRGTRNSSREQAAAALAAVERGQVVPAIARRLPLEAVADGLDALRAGGLGGRVVIDPTAAG